MDPGGMKSMESMYMGGPADSSARMDMGPGVCGTHMGKMDGNSMDYMSHRYSVDHVFLSVLR